MISRKDIVRSLTDVGIGRGDHLVVHASLRSIGAIDGGADAAIDALVDVVGDGGTVAMPSFHYTRPLPEPHFDVRTTPAKTGTLTEVFRQRAGVRRSLHPTHAVCALGPRADEFLDDHLTCEAVGKDSPLDRIAQAGGYVLLIGVSHLANTTIHVGQCHAGLARYHWQDGPVPIAKVLLADNRVVEHPLDASAGCSLAFNAVDYLLRQRGLVRDTYIGHAPSSLMRGRDIIDTVVATLKERPDALLCNRQACRPCVLGRRHSHAAAERSAPNVVK